MCEMGDDGKLTIQHFLRLLLSDGEICKNLFCPFFPDLNLWDVNISFNLASSDSLGCVCVQVGAVGVI